MPFHVLELSVKRGCLSDQIASRVVHFSLLREAALVPNTIGLKVIQGTHP